MTIKTSAILLPRSSSRQVRTSEASIAAFAILLVIGLQVFLVFNQTINWDEFFHFSQIYELHQGRLTRDLQVLHTRVFGWAAHLDLDVVGQIQAARLGMIGFELISLFSIVSLARLFADRESAWLAGLAWLGGGYVFLHGFSFRGDPMATAALMSALYIVGRRKLDAPAVLLASILIGFAFMTNLKSVLYAPCFAGVAWLRLSQSPRRLALTAQFAAIAVLAPLCFAVMYYTHRADLPAGEFAANHLRSSGVPFFSEGLFPNGRHAAWQLAVAPVLTVATVISGWLYWRSKRPLAEGIALVGLLAPLAAVVVYRNAFPYYFAFAMAPYAVAAAAGFAWLRDRYGSIPVVIALAATPIVLTSIEPRDRLPRQRAVIAEVDRLFPGNEPYLSYSGIAANHPRVLNILTSGVGIASYHRRGRAVIAEEVAAQRIAFVIADNRNLRAALSGKPLPESFLPDDAKALHNNYIPYWGPLWLPGKRLERSGSLAIDVAAEYTLADAPIRLDDKIVRPGDTIFLNARDYRVTLLAGEATLWRGDRVPVPPAEPLPDALYVPF